MSGCPRLHNYPKYLSKSQRNFKHQNDPLNDKFSCQNFSKLVKTNSKPLNWQCNSFKTAFLGQILKEKHKLRQRVGAPAYLSIQRNFKHQNDPQNGHFSFQNLSKLAKTNSKSHNWPRKSFKTAFLGQILTKSKKYFNPEVKIIAVQRNLKW